MNLKYFLRGLGIGILAATIVLTISGSHRGSKMTDEAVIKRARQLGMLTKEEVEDQRLDKNLSQMKDSLASPSSEPSPIVTSQPEASVTPSNEVSPSPSASVSASKKPEKDKKDKKEDKKEVKKEKTIHIVIESGMVSQTISTYLYQKGIIGSTKDFNTYLQDTGNAYKIRAGEYDIPLDVTYAELVDIIT